MSTHLDNKDSVFCIEDTSDQNFTFYTLNVSYFYLFEAGGLITNLPSKHAGSDPEAV